MNDTTAPSATTNPAARPDRKWAVPTTRSSQPAARTTATAAPANAAKRIARTNPIISTSSLNGMVRARRPAQSRLIGLHSAQLHDLPAYPCDDLELTAQPLDVPA